MRSSNIGGQAVMEGIMMRHKDKYSIAVRRPDQEIELKVEDYKCIFGNHAFLKKPIIRGVVSFVDSLVVGTKCLMYSAEIAGDEEDEETARKNEQLTEAERSAKKAKEDKQFKWLLYITVAVSMVVSVAAFMFLPYVLASLIRGAGASEFLVTVVEAFVKLALFMGYMFLISRMKDISVAIVIVARAIAVLSVDVESRFVVFRYQGGIQRRVVLERTASTNRHQRMGKLGGVTGGFLGNDIDGSPDGGCAEQGRSTSAYHLYTFYHVSRDLFQAVHTCQC